MPDTWLGGEDILAEDLNTRRPFLVNYTSIVANTATTTTTEAVAITTPSITFKTGRAYSITYKGQYQSSIANDQLSVRVRKTNTSGATYLDSFRLAAPTANGTFMFYLGNICSNTSGADVSAVVVGTFVRTSGTGNVLIIAGATNPAYLEIWDVGPATDFSGATAIT